MSETPTFPDFTRAWTNAWTGGKPFPDFTQAWGGKTPPAVWPLAGVQSLWFETPVAVANHIQRFAAGQMQAQVQLFADLSREDGPVNVMAKEAAFLQQSAIAWSMEMLEVASLVQSKVLTAAQKPAEPAEYPLPRAA